MVEVTQGWEAFCDRSYFDMWCVRKVGDRAFGQGFHVMTQGEAEALRELLTTAQAQAAAQEQRIVELEAENAALKQDALGFIALWANQYARNYGLPKGSIHPKHYDTLVKFGGNADAFARAALSEKVDG